MDPLLNQSFSLQVHNPLGGSMNFDPLVYWLTQQDIKDSASPTLKTSFTGWNISMTDVIMQDIQDLSKRKYSTIVLPDGMEDRESWLYLNNERMGYWNKPSNDWTAYIDNQENFRLSHPTLADNSLEWNSTLGTLTIQWDITGSTITGSTFKTSNNPTRIEISNDEIRWYDDNGSWVGVLVSTIKPWSFVWSAWTVNGTQITGNLSVSWETILNYLRLNSYLDQRSTWSTWSLIRRTNASTTSPALIVESLWWGSGAKFRTTSSDPNDFDIETDHNIAVGTTTTNAKIYLWAPWFVERPYIWNDSWTLTWNDWFWNNHPLH